jgi:hypothetical protein
VAEADALTETKSEFAHRIGRTPGRITQLITEGKLSSPAVTPEGRIVVALAKAQLKDRLDPTQQLGRDAPIGGDDQLLGAAADEEAAGEKPLGARPTDTTRYLKAKADERELEVEASAGA